jgi:hypothetical protein
VCLADQGAQFFATVTFADTIRPCPIKPNRLSSTPTFLVDPSPTILFATALFEIPTCNSDFVPVIYIVIPSATAMSDSFGARTLKRKNVKGLALNAPAPRVIAPSEDQQLAGGQDDGPNGRTAQLEIGIEYKLDLKREDLEVLKELGSGNGGTVSKVRHIATGTIMARKVCSAVEVLSVRRGLTAPVGHTRRGQEGNPSSHCQRASHHARVQLRLHSQFLWCIFK